MPQHIFYSWQSDTSKTTGKNLIARALGDAIEALNANATVDAADRDDEEIAVLDQDTAGVPGSPPIVETIFGKIDRAAAFVSDLTYVSERADGRRSPNPNVLFEHGWAWKSLSWRAVVSVMNTAHGHPNRHPLPFDLQHSKGPIFFDCPDDATVAQRQVARAGLAKALVPRLKDILSDEVLRAGRVPAAPAEPHPHDLDLVVRWRQALGEPLRQLLREQNFGDAYLRSHLSPLHEIYETWHGAQFEFEDPELQRPFKAFLDANAAFCALLNERTHIMDAAGKFAWPKSELDRKLGLQKSTLKAIDQLNKLASATSDLVDDFDRAVRGRIRVPIQIARTLAADSDDAKRAWAREAISALSTDRAKGGVPRIVSRPCLIVRIAPFAAQEGKRLDPRVVANAQRHFPPDEKVRVEESSDARQWWTCAVPVPVPDKNSETRWLVRLVRPGLIEAEVTIAYREEGDDAIMIDGNIVEREFVSWSERLAAALVIAGLSGRGLVQLSLDGIEDVVLQRARPGGKKIGYPSLFLALIEVEDLAAQLAAPMQEAFDILWQSAGWRDGSPSFEGDRWAGYSV